MSELDLSKEELQTMLTDKVTELANTLEEMAKLKNEIVNMKARTLKVHEENQLLTNSPEYAKMAGQMKFHLEMAEKFAKSKAFPSYSPEQIYVIIKAGAEMDLKPMQSLQSLYIYNGKVEPYGKALSFFITRAGYIIKYSEETVSSVKVTVSKDNFEASETVSTKDPILANKLKGDKKAAIKFAPRQKIRYHALRMILSFHLPHLISGTPDLFENDVLEMIQKDSEHTMLISANSKISELLESAESLEDVLELEDLHKASITKDIALVQLLGKMKMKFSNSKNQ